MPETLSEPSAPLPAAPLAASAAIERIVAAVEQRVVGQRSAVEELLAAYLAGGHVLLEGVPGIGKTLLARTFAGVLGLAFQRVQFTPDLMPADVIGTNVFDQESRSFRLVRGPIFTEILMADEVNRTPPKTQAALLEAMQESQVSIDGVRHPLGDGFFVVATSNPVELEGTYPLPEAQLDRFLLRVEMGLPSPADERELFRRAVAGELPLSGFGAAAEPVVDRPTALALRRAATAVHVDEALLDYLARLAAAVRGSAHVELAISPRGALALLEAARAGALVEGRDFVVPDDLKRFLRPCWGHRLILDAEAELEGHSVERLLDAAASAVEVPR